MMRKNLMSRLSLVLAITAVLASCTKKSGEYTHAIPADASAVVGIHLQSLVDKSGVSNDDKQKLIDMMKSELDATTFEHIESIIKDGSASGISVKDPMYIFASNQLPSAAAVMKVSDIGKLNKTFEVMVAEQIVQAPTQTNGYNLVHFDGNVVCAYNESMMLIIEGRDSERIASSLMTQREDNSISKSPYFEAMLKKKGEITFFFDMDALPAMYKSQMNLSLGDTSEIDPKEIGIAGSVSFEKGKIALNAEMISENEQMKQLMNKQQDISGKLNETFLSNFPASTLMYASFNVNGEKLYEFIQDNKEFRKNLSQEKAEKVKEIISAFKGDISFGLINVTMSDMPTFTAYAEAKNGEALEALYAAKSELGLRSSEDIAKLGDNEYVYRSGRMNIFFGYKDKYMYATSDEQIYKNIGKKESTTLKDAPYASNMKGKRQYMVIDMKAILDLPAVKMVSAMGGREAAMYLNIASKISYFEVASEGGNQSTMNLWLQDKDTNALKQIIDLAKVYVGL